MKKSVIEFLQKIGIGIGIGIILFLIMAIIITWI